MGDYTVVRAAVGTRALRVLAAGLAVTAVPIFLITTNVWLVINVPVLYSYGFDRYNIVEWTGIERDELLSAGRQVRDYFKNDEGLLDVRVFVQGVRRSIYNEREILHMRDVKSLVKAVYSAQQITGIYLVLFAAVGLAIFRRPFLAPLVRLLRLGGMATLGLVLLVGFGSILGFDRLFHTFHLISFSNDLWQLDPRTDMLIRMFPQGFFFDATIAIAVLTLVESAILAFAPAGWRRWRLRRGPEVASRATATPAPEAGG